MCWRGNPFSIARTKFPCCWPSPALFPVCAMHSILVVLLLLLLTHCVCSSKGLLSRQRIYSEFRDIADQMLTLDIPFNTSLEECGIRLSPMKNNMLDWHFSFTGVEGSPYEGGVYHGTISLSSHYPRKAPVIRMKSPSGRWKVNEEICLSASAHHPELWDPSWNLRTLVLSLRGFMTTQPNEIGGIRATANEKQLLMEKSKNYICPTCHVMHRTLLPLDGTESPFERNVDINRSSRLLHSGTRIVDTAVQSAISITHKRTISNKGQPKKTADHQARQLQKSPKVSNIHKILRICVVLFGSMLMRHFVDAIVKYGNDVVMYA